MQLEEENTRQAQQGNRKQSEFVKVIPIGVNEKKLQLANDIVKTGQTGIAAAGIAATIDNKKFSEVLELDFKNKLPNEKVASKILNKLTEEGICLFDFNKAEGAPTFAKIVGEIKASNLDGVKAVLGLSDKSSEDRSLIDKISQKNIFLVSEDIEAAHGSCTTNVPVVNLNALGLRINHGQVTNNDELQATVANELITSVLFDHYKFTNEKRANWQLANYVIDTHVKPMSSIEVNEFISNAASLATTKQFFSLLIDNMIGGNYVTQKESYRFSDKFLEKAIDGVLEKKGVVPISLKSPIINARIEHLDDLISGNAHKKEIIDAVLKTSNNIKMKLTDADLDKVKDLYLKQAQEFIKVIKSLP